MTLLKFTICTKVGPKVANVLEKSGGRMLKKNDSRHRATVISRQFDQKSYCLARFRYIFHGFVRLNSFLVEKYKLFRTRPSDPAPMSQPPPPMQDPGAMSQPPPPMQDPMMFDEKVDFFGKESGNRLQIIIFDLKFKFFNAKLKFQ